MKFTDLDAYAIRDMKNENLVLATKTILLHMCENVESDLFDGALELIDDETIRELDQSFMMSQLEFNDDRSARPELHDLDVDDHEFQELSAAFLTEVTERAKHDPVIRGDVIEAVGSGIARKLRGAMADWQERRDHEEGVSFDCSP